jgi:hypothetical protein
MCGDHGKKSGKRAGLAANQKCRALRCEGISAFSVLLQQFEPDECVHDHSQSTLGRACFLADLLDCFRPAFERVKHFVVHRRADNERRRITKPKLHQAFRRDLLFLGLFHGQKSTSASILVQSMDALAQDRCVGEHRGRWSS